MRAAAKRQQDVEGIEPAHLIEASWRDPVTQTLLDGARQDFLEALPIAAGMAGLNDRGELILTHANASLRCLVDARQGLPGGVEATRGIMGKEPVISKLHEFLNGTEAALEFACTDGWDVAAHHYGVRLARLRSIPGFSRRCLISFLDKTAEVESERSLRAELLRDSLTGLPNRSAFTEQVAAVLEEPTFEAGRFAVLMVDVTRFSRVNECMGAIAGDELLITFARRLISALRAGDVLARTGGDEFGALIRLDDGVVDALQVAERIESVLATPFRLSELEIRVDCAIGCAVLADTIESAEEALRNAQFALKLAKQSGRIHVYEPNQASEARRRFSIETELRRAIENQQLTLAFQPLIHLATREVAGFEALARWEHPTRGSISPNEFIPVAEESGLIVALGRWALDTAAQTLASWDAASGCKVPVRVAVNLSPIQIARDDVAASVFNAIHSAGIDGDRLTIELTESAIVFDPQRASAALDALKALDAQVAMDDFGTGYTSLAFLQRLPIDVLKIDRSLVTGMLDDRDSVEIIRAILSLAEALGMETIAEGVESEEEALSLTALGCSYGQGFHFAQPLPADKALDYWRSRKALAT